MTKFAVLRPESNDSFDSRSTRFAQSWLLAPHASRSVRRRLAAILRMACRTLGCKRGRGLGMLGFGSRIAGAAVASALIAGFASDALAGDGIFINDGTDGGCTVIRDGGTKPTIENIASDKCSKNDDVQYQTDRVLFYSYNNGTDKQSTSLSLGQFLWVNGGWIGLNQQTTKSMAIGNLGTAASGQDAIAIGNDAKASSNRSVAIGEGSNANGGTLSNGAWFVGGSASAEMNIGSRRITGVAAGAMDSDAANVGQVKAAKNDTDNSIKTINTNINNIINNGTKGLVEQASPGQNLTVGKDIDGAAVDFAGKNKADGTKILRKLINVAPGAVNKDSNEVIVGKQLFETNTAVTNIDNRVTKNEGDIVSIDTSIGDITTQVGGLLSDALLWDKDKLAFSAKHGTGGTNRIADVKAGENDTDAVNVGQLKAAQGTATTALKNAGDRAVKYVWDDKNKDGVLDAGEVDYTRANLEGPANAGTVLGNVAKGEVSAKSFDAVNGSQLYANNGIIANWFGGGAGYDKDGVFQGPNYEITVINQDGTTTKNHNNVGDALGGIDNSVRIVNSKVDYVTSTVGGMTKDALRWDPDRQVFTAHHSDDPLSREFSGPNKITDLQAATLSEKSTDAVNGSQLNDTNNRVTNVENRITTVEGDVINIDNRLTTVEGDVNNIKTDIANITTDVGSLTDRAVQYDGKTGDPKALITLQGDNTSLH
jgi:archaellum component FlaC